MSTTGTPTTLVMDLMAARTEISRLNAQAAKNQNEKNALHLEIGSLAGELEASTYEVDHLRTLVKTRETQMRVLIDELVKVMDMADMIRLLEKAEIGVINNMETITTTETIITTEKFVDADDDNDDASGKEPMKQADGVDPVKQVEQVENDAMLAAELQEDFVKEETDSFPPLEKKKKPTQEEKNAFKIASDKAKKAAKKLAAAEKKKKAEAEAIAAKKAAEKEHAQEQVRINGQVFAASTTKTFTGDKTVYQTPVQFSTRTVEGICLHALTGLGCNNPNCKKKHASCLPALKYCGVQCTNDNCNSVNCSFCHTKKDFEANEVRVSKALASGMDVINVCRPLDNGYYA